MEQTQENKLQNKKSFILYLDSADIFEQLSDEEAGKLIKGILYFVHTGNNPNLDRLLQMAFTPIKQSLKRDLDRWRKQIQTNRENGLLGGRPKGKTQKTQMVIKKPIKSKANQKNPVNVNVNVNDSVNVNVNDSVNEIPEYIDFLNYALSKEPFISKHHLKLKYEAWKENGWKNGNDKKIKNWKSSLLNTIPHLEKENKQERSMYNFSLDNESEVIDG